MENAVLKIEADMAYEHFIKEADGWKLWLTRNTKACAAETTEMQLYRTIYPSPYFSHMEISGDDGDKMQIMLSDAENLNENIQIDDQKMIMPFKNGGGRQNQLLRALYHAYQEHDKADWWENDYAYHCQVQFYGADVFYADFQGVGVLRSK